VILIAVVFCLRALGQEPDQAVALFSSDVRLAVVQFQVEHDNRYVSGLKSSDFRLLEDGQDVPINHFEGVEAGGHKTPVDVILLFDGSGSVMSHGLLNEELFRESLLDDLPEVSIAIYRFGSHLTRMTRPTRDPGELRKAFEGVMAGAHGEMTCELGPPTGSSLIFEAVSETIRDVRLDRTPSRKLLLVISDGIQAGGTPDPRKATAQALEADIRVYPVVVGRARGRGNYELLVDRFASLGKSTAGGEFSFGRLDARAARHVIEHLADWIRNTYVVGFSPQDDSQQHRHKVEVLLQPGKKAKVRNGTRFVVH
jgi:VWFA-related protein